MEGQKVGKKEEKINFFKLCLSFLEKQINEMLLESVHRDQSATKKWSLENDSMIEVSLNLSRAQFKSGLDHPCLD